MDKGYIVIRTVMWVLCCLMGIYFMATGGKYIAASIFGLLAIGFLWQGIYWYRNGSQKTEKNQDHE
jgi:hypothetical protein